MNEFCVIEDTIDIGCVESLTDVIGILSFARVIRVFTGGADAGLIVDAGARGLNSPPPPPRRSGSLAKSEADAGRTVAVAETGYC
jgi:hypothetical protein